MTEEVIGLAQLTGMIIAIEVIEKIADQGHLAKKEGMTEAVDHQVDIAGLVDQVDQASQVNQTIRTFQNCQTKT
jgi:hypothetical protein